MVNIQVKSLIHFPKLYLFQACLLKRISCHAAYILLLSGESQPTTVFMILANIILKSVTLVSTAPHSVKGCLEFWSLKA